VEGHSVVGQVESLDGDIARICSSPTSIVDIRPASVSFIYIIVLELARRWQRVIRIWRPRPAHATSRTRRWGVEKAVIVVGVHVINEGIRGYRTSNRLITAADGEERDPIAVADDENDG
jgi:hypothetical protein